jgi:hypothetical protein
MEEIRATEAALKNQDIKVLFAKSTKTTTTTIYEVSGSPYYLFALGPFALIIIYIIIYRILKITEV